MSLRAALLPAFAVALAAGCAAYRPAPIVPATEARQIEARSLDDPRLAQFIDAVAQRDEPVAHAQAPARGSARTVMPAHGPRSWDLGTLTLAALYFHPSLRIARARFREAEAGVRTAREISNPTLGFEDLSHSVGAPAAWTVSPVIDFLIETAGKRSRRTAEARALTRAALADVTTAAWQVRAGVRAGMIGSWAAEQRLTLLRERLGLQGELVTLLEHRFAAGEASALDLERERVNESQLRLAIRNEQTRAADARAALAAAIGIPLSALDSTHLSFAGLGEARRPPDEAQLRREALTGRSDVRAMLADYAAAEASLALQVASQYPNITLGPGYSFDSVRDRYILLPQIELPLFNHHRGPIAAALARRDEAAARFTALQLQVLGQVDGALADLQSTTAALATADALLREERDREQRTAQSFQAGALDRPTLLAAQIERSIAEQSRLDALIAQRQALGAVEDALQHPLYLPRARWLAASTDVLPQAEGGR